MARRRLIWKVMPVYLLVISLSTLAIAWYAGQSVRELLASHAREQLKQDVVALADDLAPLMRSEPSAGEIQRLLSRAAARTEVRFSVFNNQHQLVNDSRDDTLASVEQTDMLPELAQADREALGVELRRDPRTDVDTLFLAVAVRQGDQIVGYVRGAMPMTLVHAAVNRVYYRVALGGLIMGLLATLVTFVVFSRQISRPLQHLRDGARRFANGELGHTLPVADTEEVGSLAEALNSMAHQLHAKVRASQEQANERQTILSSMTEGLLAVDSNERVITVNAAAAKLLQLDPNTIAGKRIYEVIRNVDLQEIIARALGNDEVAEGELTLRTKAGPRHLQVHGSALRDTDQQRIGAVVVITDVTQLRQLELIRQNFVANVSHELKTPITAIKAAVETLLVHSGDQDEPSQRFMGMIHRQADRLNAIVEDLLTLARIQQEQDRDELQVERLAIDTIIKAAVETCQAKAQERSVHLVVESSDHPFAIANGTLLEQAVVNLVDNAVKYSDADCTIRVRALRRDKEAIVEVSDDGPGIEEKHLPRIFERFYRTDRARSRELGGTGLGLAIVKHVAQTHGGRVSVDSQLGHGSTFRIHLPAA